jgi:hypothetical protein
VVDALVELVTQRRFPASVRWSVTPRAVSQSRKVSTAATSSWATT